MINLIERFEAFTTSITKAYKCIQKIKIMEAERIGLKANHIMYMYYLGKNPEGLTSIDLCKLCIEDKAAVSRGIVDLTEKGFVELSQTDLGRKYRTKFILTSEGCEINKKLNDAIAIAVNKASSDLSEIERANFYNVLFNITNNIEKIYESYIKDK